MTYVVFLGWPSDDRTFNSGLSLVIGVDAMAIVLFLRMMWMGERENFCHVQAYLSFHPT